MDTTAQICAPVTVMRNGYQRFTLNLWYPLANGYQGRSTALVVTDRHNGYRGPTTGTSLTDSHNNGYQPDIMAGLYPLAGCHHG